MLARQSTPTAGAADSEIGQNALATPRVSNQQANIYFDGQVTSRSVIFQDGSRKTRGIMLPGEYEFNTDEKELMEIISGDLDVLLPNAEWQSIKGGENFEVPAGSKFQLKVAEITDYCCSFIKG